MKIYTKAGDDGSTGLLGGDRVFKTDLRIEAIGEVDEVNAVLGVARTLGLPPTIDQIVLTTQSNLFTVGAILANPPGSKFEAPKLSEDCIDELERFIDHAETQLTPLKNFILPGGAPSSARLHLARCVCRRAERAVLNLHATEPIELSVLKYLNRLSDCLFIAARLTNKLEGKEESIWKAN